MLTILFNGQLPPPPRHFPMTGGASEAHRLVRRKTEPAVMSDRETVELMEIIIHALCQR
jgi:hypothetical protein